VSSRPGLGTIVRFTLPFTVMMTQVLTVEAGGQAFGVPLEAVVETLRVGRADIMPVGAAQALALRNRTVPVIDLGAALGVDVSSRGPEANVLIVSVDGQLGGLEVDRLGERLDVMLKAPEGLLAGVPGIDGTTLLGDGRVLIVLDLAGIFGNARV
jgi:two-component system chemotaxis sensor kinase CheA